MLNKQQIINIIIDFLKNQKIIKIKNNLQVEGEISARKYYQITSDGRRQSVAVKNYVDGEIEKLKDKIPTKVIINGKEYLLS